MINLNLEVTKRILAQNGHYKMSDKLEVFRPYLNRLQTFPLYSSKVSAGFPSPADDNLEKSLDLNSYLIKRPAATFFVRVNGDSMINAGINDNDILVVESYMMATKPFDEGIAEDGLKKTNSSRLYPRILRGDSCTCSSMSANW